MPSPEKPVPMMSARVCTGSVMWHPPGNGGTGKIVGPRVPRVVPLLRVREGPRDDLAGRVALSRHRCDAPGADRRCRTHTVATVRMTANIASAIRLAAVPPLKV